jgi:GxxExxY protein
MNRIPKEKNGNYDLAGKVIGFAMNVHSEMGPGFLEAVYENALLSDLKKARMQVEWQKPIKVVYNGNVVGDFIADLVIENELIIEVKAVQSLVKAHEAQLVNYLTATKIDTGLLLNAHILASFDCVNSV